ncbi:MAG: energy-coupling factor transporter ATPase [Lachnospiraceae bacterium]|nr:energy-coupling factor transporter ATPase [Lachnospiraceae bacterium]
MQLDFENITCIYDADTKQPVTALNDVSLHVGESEFIGLIGHTGSGKSTLIQHANGLIRPTSGRVLADGEDIWGPKFDRKKHRSRVGLVFQYPEHQLFETDIISDVSFGPKNQGLEPDRIRERAEKALMQVGISEELYEHSPFDLSGGQKRRVAIAGVLAMEPEILILDEPTAGLDPRGRREVYSLMKKLREERGITVIIVSHSMEEIAEGADRILVMDRGKLAFDEAPSKLFDRREELEAMDLAIPKARYLLDELKNRGLVNLDTSPLTAHGAAQAICNAIRSSKG